MNKPLQTIIDSCQDTPSLAKARDVLAKSYEQHLKALNDLRTVVKKSMTEAIASENFDALDEQKVLLERAKLYAEQLESLTEPKLGKSKPKRTEE